MYKKTFSMAEAAAVLSTPKYKLSNQDLYFFLRNLGIIEAHINRPIKAYIEKGYLIESSGKTSANHNSTYSSVRFTESGLQWLRLKVYKVIKIFLDIEEKGTATIEELFANSFHKTICPDL
jgi:hypothetical protein